VILGRLFRLLALAALAVAGWWIARSWRGRHRPPPGPAKDRPPSTARMVRDHMCNTFLPLDRALTVRVGGATHYFCSESCRLRFERERGAVAPA